MNCLIIDDEQPSREELKYFIENHSSITIAEEFENSIQALKYLQTCHGVDMIFLDINMPNLDGMELARIINRFRERPEIVFVSAHREYAHDAFEVEAFDYILKPYSGDRIIKVLSKLEGKLANKEDDKRRLTDKKITLTNGEKILVLKLDEIAFIKANERKTDIFYNSNDQFCANVKFSEVEEKIIAKNFFKCHRSYLVNLDKIKEIDVWFNNTYLLTMENITEKVPVSRSFVKEFKEMMHIN
ncbi:MAG: response regulator transcription factor [Tissierellales bacterium]|nr:response regulator transcription factor [Tissierellales bacterium]MBN2828444.1 response regulator transcription factor [Tissierellales bacterium]